MYLHLRLSRGYSRDNKLEFQKKKKKKKKKERSSIAERIGIPFWALVEPLLETIEVVDREQRWIAL